MENALLGEKGWKPFKPRGITSYNRYEFTTSYCSGQIYYDPTAVYSWLQNLLLKKQEPISELLTLYDAYGNTASNLVMPLISFYDTHG